MLKSKGSNLFLVRWQDLPIIIVELCNEPQSHLRESGFKIISSYPDIIPDSKLNSVGSAFCKYSTESQPMVLLASLSAFIALVINSENSRQDMLSQYLPQMLKVLETFYIAKDEASVSSAIEAFIDLADSKGDVLVKYIQDLLKFCVGIMSDGDLEDATRHLGLELILTLVDAASAKCKKYPELVEHLVPLVLQWMASFEDEEAWYITSELEDGDDDSFQMIGQYGIDRLACSLGGKFLLPVSFRYIKQMLRSEVWQQRHAALLAVSTIGEGCAKLMVKDMNNIVSLVLPYLKDPHPRVRYATLNSIGQLATDFPDEFAVSFHTSILGMVIPLLEDSAFPRVQAHAAAALLNLCERLDKTMLEPYLSILLDKLFSLLNGSPAYIQEQVLTTIASIADSAEDRFGLYYDSIMPMLVTIMEGAVGKEYQMLRAKAIECSSLIGLAVGSERFRPNAESFANLLYKIQGEVTEVDDPLASYLQQAWTRVALILGKEFLSYLPLVIPELVVAADQKPNVVILEKDEEPEENYPSDQGWEFRRAHGQQVGIRTSLMDDKCTAIEMLICYAQALESEFASYASDLIPRMLALFNFYFHSGVRHAAIRSIHPLLYCLIDAGYDRSDIDALRKEIFIVQMRQLNIESEQEYVNLVLSSFHEVINVVGPQSLTRSEVVKFNTVVMPRVERVVEQLSEYARVSSQPDYDEDEVDPEILDEVAFNQDFMQTLSQCFHNVVRLHGSQFFQELVPLTSMANRCFDSPSPHVRQWAVGVFDDIVEHGGQEATAFFQGCFIEPFLTLLLDPSPFVRQAVSYGVGLWAKFGGPAYAEGCSRAIEPLFASIDKPDARTQDNDIATDNAVSAICKIMEHSPSSVADPDNVIQRWLNALPIKSDPEEVPEVYRFLLNLFDLNHPHLVGSPATLSRLAIILAQAIIDDLLDQDLKNSIFASLRKILQASSEQFRSELWNRVPDDKRNLFTPLL
ncbi:importin subunit beta-3, variant 2 [Entomophthora muscae]|uniref:Importin subunit beta-3, variant 2 n=2 Tax=Entomophthora muscae TaxID=34485 RepID=A0ACC2TMW0_9FUNG|nr:importin subunit beta-3, variant 2 [Entomophthora muscae]